MVETDQNHLLKASFKEINGVGPARWSAIATANIEAMRDEGYDYSTWSLIRQRAITVVCFAFVDDTDLIHLAQDPEVSMQQMLTDAQDPLTLWEGLLQGTGGALAPKKSYWYLVDVIRHKGKWTYTRESQRPFEMTLK
jgi:hypothetical protein